MQTLALGPSWLDPSHLISTFGLLGIAFVIFAECGLLVGFFLPGDTLLFTAGLLVRTGSFTTPLWAVCLIVAVAAVLGNQTGYYIGRKAGPALFRREDSALFKREYVEKSEHFFERYGARAIVLARFVPIVRTFITAIAGASRMHYRTYLIYTIVGGVLWAVSITCLGYALGGIQFFQDNVGLVELAIVAVVALSIVPVILGVVTSRVRSRRR